MLTYARTNWLAVYAFANLALFIVLFAAGQTLLAIVLAVISFLVFAYRRLVS